MRTRNTSKKAQLDSVEYRLIAARFLFAINTISMVKNDALFSYVAPGNIFAWMLMPLRYCMPLQQFVWLNRFIIKVTHFPLLFCIYFYEKYFLASSMYEPTDLVEHPGRGRQRQFSLADPTSRAALFSPNVRVREESVAGFQKDRALEEVFRRAPDYSTLRTQRREERRKAQTAIRNWMDQNETIEESPHNYSTMDSRAQQDWRRKLNLGRDRPSKLRQFSEARSVASDPADLLSNHGFRGASNYFDSISRHDYAMQSEIKDNTDADGDDELVTNDEDEEDNATNAAESRRSNRPPPVEEEDYFTTPVATRFTRNPPMSASVGSSTAPLKQTPPQASPRPPRRNMHSRTLSTNTILYNPPAQPQHQQEESFAPPMPSSQVRSRPLSSRHTPAASPGPGPGRRSPRRSVYLASRPRPILPPRDMAHTAPNRAALGLPLEPPGRRSQPRRLSSLDLAVDNQSDLAGLAAANDTYGAVPSSFATQMAMATGMMTPAGLGGGAGLGRRDSDRMSRLMLARMKTLEEGFADIVHEMRVMRSSGHPTANNSASEGSWKGRPVPGLATIEIAGHDRAERSGLRRVKTVASRPGSRRGNKGKQVQQSDADDSDDGDAANQSFATKGSSL